MIMGNTTGGGQEHPAIAELKKVDEDFVQKGRLIRDTEDRGLITPGAREFLGQISAMDYHLAQAKIFFRYGLANRAIAAVAAIPGARAALYAHFAEGERVSIPIPGGYLTHFLKTPNLPKEYKPLIDFAERCIDEIEGALGTFLDNLGDDLK